MNVCFVDNFRIDHAVSYTHLDVYKRQEEAFANMKAVQNKQVYTFPSSLETWDTPNLSSCLGVLWAYATLYPEHLSMQDVKTEAVKFYQTFYGIDVNPDRLGF